MPTTGGLMQDAFRICLASKLGNEEGMELSRILDYLGRRTRRQVRDAATRLVRAVDLIDGPPPRDSQPQVQEDDRWLATLAPDAILVLDPSLCIVLATPERRMTVGNVDAWCNALDNARIEQRVQEALK